MSIARLTTVSVALLAISNLFAGCAANVGLPRGAITSNQTCEDEGDCTTWHAPQCYLNLEQCYKGLCVMKKKAGCTPAIQ